MTRSLPSRPNLNHLKNEAKALLKTHAHGDVDCCGLLRHLHRFADEPDAAILAADVSLSDVQFALAMDYGFVSWRALKEHVEATDQQLVEISSYVDKTLTQALETGSSDVHFEPSETSLRIRFRTDGVLRDIDSLPKEQGTLISERLKQLAGIDERETGEAHQGHFNFRSDSQRKIGFHLATLATTNGEKTTCRVFDTAVSEVPLDKLGYTTDQLALVRDALAKPGGLILFTGPAASGKTVSLYTALSQLDNEKLSITTLEDPVELPLANVSQCRVNHSGGGFAGSLGSILSTNPDVIMISDLSDPETCRTAFAAAERGLTILGTLPTSSAAETLLFLRTVGIPAPSIIRTVKLVVTQRLARRLCTKCKTSFKPDSAMLDVAGVTDAGTVQLYGPKGCSECHDGYLDRFGVFEVVAVKGAVADAVANQLEQAAIDAACRQACYPGIRDVALQRLQAGETSLEEVQRITAL